MNDLNELITSHTMRSFNAGRKYEFDKLIEAIKLCHQTNNIGDYVYVSDLLEHLEEVSAKVSTK